MSVSINIHDVRLKTVQEMKSNSNCFGLLTGKGNPELTFFFADPDEYELFRHFMRRLEEMRAAKRENTEAEAA